MADTRTLTGVLFQVEHAAGKLVLVGDPAQLPAVGPGGLFARSSSEMGPSSCMTIAASVKSSNAARSPFCAPGEAATTSPTPPSRAG